MDLYTSISKPKEGRFLVGLSICCSINILLIWIYFAYFNPELIFWREAMEEKINHATEEAAVQPKVYIIGGSSCAFSVIPEVVSVGIDCDVENLGIHAGAGRNTQLELGLQLLKPGDTLILAFETSFWTQEEPFGTTALGSQIAYSFPDYFLRDQINEQLEINNDWSIFDLRPGGKHIISMLGKVVLGKDLYRYSSEDIKTGGFLVYQGAMTAPPSGGLVAPPNNLPKRITGFLENISEYCRENEINIAVSFPWLFTTEEASMNIRTHNIALAKHIEKFLPVLKDSNWGVETDKNLYSDTSWHLNEKGARIRSKIIRSGIALMKSKRKDPATDVSD